MKAVTILFLIFTFLSDSLDGMMSWQALIRQVY
jgi:hypothetical protein